MKSLKYNFTIPEETAKKLMEFVADRKRSAFVTAAIDYKIKQLEEEALNQALIEGYLARREEDSQINEEWEGPTLERWG